MEKMNILIVEDNVDNHESAHFLCLVNKGGCGVLWVFQKAEASADPCHAAAG
ncbi:MAG: hypothetical protein M1485_01360 [Chloroflexi bacterium]|nr:hypothetical protein [Chloroflexota bacterium]